MNTDSWIIWKQIYDCHEWVIGELIQDKGDESVDIMKEVDSFRAVDCVSLNADPLEWWKTPKHLHPHTAKLAQRYLAVPGTSVPSERVYAHEREINQISFFYFCFFIMPLKGNKKWQVVIIVQSL